MTNQEVKKRRQAVLVLSKTTEREAIKTVVHLVLPQDGSPITNKEIVEWVHGFVDPVHELLQSKSPSYTDVNEHGTRKKNAIYATTQWFGPGSSKKKNGNHWVERSNGTVRYKDNGAELANEFFGTPKFKSILDAIDTLT